MDAAPLQMGHPAIRQLKVGLSVTLIFLSSVLVAGCGEHAFESGASITISSDLPRENGVLQWDPNDEHVLALSVTGDIPVAEAATIRWRQEGWQVDDSQWVGPDLRVDIKTPGCGFGGQEFVISAYAGDGTLIGSARIWMAPYICDGSRWQTD